MPNGQRHASVASMKSASFIAQVLLHVQRLHVRNVDLAQLEVPKEVRGNGALAANRIVAVAGVNEMAFELRQQRNVLWR